MFADSLNEIIEQQFILAKYGISVTESNVLADFEREAFFNLAMRNEHLELEKWKAQCKVNLPT